MVCSTVGSGRTRPIEEAFMSGYAVAQMSTTWLIVGGGIAMLLCFFVVSGAILAVVLIRHSRRQRGALDVQVNSDGGEASADQGLPPVA
jgi:hypothetical protein